VKGPSIEIIIEDFLSQSGAWIQHSLRKSKPRMPFQIKVHNSVYEKLRNWKDSLANRKNIAIYSPSEVIPFISLSNSYTAEHMNHLPSSDPVSNPMSILDMLFGDRMNEPSSSITKLLAFSTEEDVAVALTRNKRQLYAMLSSKGRTATLLKELTLILQQDTNAMLYLDRGSIEASTGALNQALSYMIAEVKTLATSYRLQRLREKYATGNGGDHVRLSKAHMTTVAFAVKLLKARLLVDESIAEALSRAVIAT
jgi:hypothetical protein